MALLLTLPFTIPALILYLVLTFFGNNFLIWVIGISSGILIILFIIYHEFKLFLSEARELFSFKNLPFIALILFFVFTKAFVLSPLVFTKTVDSFKHIQITDVGDYYKHNFVVTSLKLDGIPPENPYFPSSKLSYYYGYYLTPAAISKIFNIAPNLSFYIYFIFADIICLLVIFLIINRHLKFYWMKLLSLLLLISGLGVDVLRADINFGLQVINNYKSFLFVPQHFFAACLTIAVIYSLIYEKPKKIYILISVVFIFLCSLFVSLTLIFWFLVLFIFYPSKRIYLIISGVLSAIILLPYFLQLSGRGNILYFYKFEPFEFIKTGNALITYHLNLLLTFFVKYGPILFVFPIILISKKLEFIKKNLKFILGLLSPFILTWFIRSANFNDFSLRTLMPVQIILPLFFTKMVGNSEGLSKKIFILIAILAVILGFFGFFKEYANHWKSRIFLPPKVSELIFEIRKIPDTTKLAALDRDRWVEFIPSLGFKKVTSPFLFDSYVYFADGLGKEHGEYERLAIDLFIEPNVFYDLNSLVDKENELLKKIGYFFNKYPSDKLIINNQLWFKNDINPYFYIFRKAGVKEEALTAHYTLFDYKDLLMKLSNRKIQINKEGMLSLKIEGKKLRLKNGLWYIAACNFGTPFVLKLEFEDYYSLFNKKVDGVNESCIGRIFYLLKDEDISLTNTSTVEDIFAFPVEIN